MKICVFCLILSTWLCACGTDNAEDKKGVIPQHQLDALEKAKNVEDVLKNVDKERRKDLDE